MKKLLFITCLTGLVLSSKAYAVGKTVGYTEPCYVDNGNSRTPFTVNVGTTTPVKIYTGSTTHRNVLIQPDVNFVLYMSSSSVFTATTGNRWKVRAIETYQTNGYGDIYGLYESAAGVGGAVIGNIEFDSSDKR